MTLVLNSCDDSDKYVYPSKVYEQYIAGQWEQVEGPDRGCIYDISITSNLSQNAYANSYGRIVTYYLTVSGLPKYDKEYSWSVRGTDGRCLLLDLVCTGELDSDDPWSGNLYYKINKIDVATMWWQANTNGDQSILKFKRRTDL